jgi:phage terminase large subunit-like protein
MTIELTASTLARWRADPVSFIEQVLINAETGKPFELLPAEREFLKHAFKIGESGKLLYPELVYSAPKKSGKTCFAAIFTLTLIILFGGAFPEATLAANDLEQAQGRVAEACKRIVEASPLLKREAKITEARITFPKIGATISAIPASFAGAAGGNQCISVFDELWAYTSERGRRLYDELVPPPTRKIACRLTVTYAGLEGESLLLESLHKRGLAQPEVAPDLHAGDGLLMFWTHKPVAPWQDEAWLSQMRRERPSAYQRMCLNEFAAAESAFVDMTAWDQCTIPSMTPAAPDYNLEVWAGIDASVKHDSTALVLCTADAESKAVRLVAHRVFTPRPDDPIDFENTIEATILEWHKKFFLRKCWFDPFQMVSVSQRLQRAGVEIEPFAQTLPNLTAATSNLFDLIQARQLMVYPDAAMRLAVSRAVLHESSRGFRLEKLKQAHKIDVVVALSMAALAAIRGLGESSYPSDPSWISDTNPGDLAKQFLNFRMGQHIRMYGGRRW